MTVTDAMLDDALRFMGLPRDERHGDGVGFEKIREEARRTFAELEAVITPRKAWGRFSVVLPVSADDDTVRTAGFEIVSRDIARLMAGASECFLMAVTIGPEADRRILAAQKRDMLGGIMTDACASVLADALCDELESELAAALPEGERLTARFSPGYGDAPLSASADIIRALDATRRIGLFMTNAMMMTPVKSVTAIAGITAAGVTPADRQELKCETCRARETCALRRRGERCF